jgi:hypothetical protein
MISTRISACAAAPTFLVSVAAAHPPAGCEPEAFAGSSASYDTRISIKPDCSFTDGFIHRSPGSGYFTVDSRSGGPAIRVGKGRLAQEIVTSEICGPAEYLLFVDCGSGESAMIAGAPPPEAEGSYLGGFFIRDIQKPHGPIALYDRTTVAELTETAKANGLDLVDDPASVQVGKRKRDRYDHVCGCKLYYPGSVAARD